MAPGTPPGCWRGPSVAAAVTGSSLCPPLPQDEPTLSESGCPARRVWVEGQRRELECRADGDPPPSTRCARDGGTRDGGTHHGGARDGGSHHGSVTRGRGGRVVTRADGGRYVCRATNRHGVAALFERLLAPTH